MSTKSILKNITITDSTMGENFVSALEHSKNKRVRDIKLSQNYKEVHGTSIRKIFSK